MSEYAKNIQKIEDLWKKRIELQDGGGRMTEYIISVDDSLRWDYSKRQYEHFFGFPIEEVEIVRCRDCKHYMDYEHEFEPNLGYCREFDREEVRDSCFCAWAERREP